MSETPRASDVEMQYVLAAARLHGSMLVLRDLMRFYEIVTSSRAFSLLGLRTGRARVRLVKG